MDSFLAEVEEIILDNASPFKSISDDGRSGLANYLNSAPEGQDHTRKELCEKSEQLKDDFFAKLPFVGAEARWHGLTRMADEAAIGERPSFSLEHSDLLFGEFVVSASLTILCPTIP